MQKPNTSTMKIKMISALIVIAAISITTFAGPFKHDSTKVRNNEIGLNIAPLASGLMGASTFSPKYTVTYKKLCEQKSALRFSLSYVARNGNSYFWSGPDSYDNYDVLSSSDSVQLRRYHTYKPGNKIQLSIGYEYRWGKKKLKHFVGADITGGYYKTTNVWEDKEYILRVWDSPNSGTSDSLPTWGQNTSAPTSIARQITADMFYIGLNPFYGLRYDVSKRFTLSAQTGFDLSFDFGNSYDDNYANGTYTEGRQIWFNFETIGLISDLSLIYHF